MKLEEITDKERFINQLKDPKLEEVRVGLEKLSIIFADKGWKLETKLDDNGMYWLYIVSKVLGREKKNYVDQVVHVDTMKKIFPNKLVYRHPEEENENTFVYSIDVYKDFYRARPGFSA